MASNPQLTGEGFSSIAGMSKSQLYELMSQMKVTIWNKALSDWYGFVGLWVGISNCAVFVSRYSFLLSRIVSKRGRFWLTTLRWQELFSRWKHAYGCSAGVRIWFMMLKLWFDVHTCERKEFVLLIVEHVFFPKILRILLLLLTI